MDGDYDDDATKLLFFLGEPREGKDNGIECFAFFILEKKYRGQCRKGESGDTYMDAFYSYIFCAIL